MGVCCVLYAVSDDHIAQCLADPPLVWQVVEPEDERAYLDELASQAKVPCSRGSSERARQKPVARTLRFSAPERREVDLGQILGRPEGLPEAPGPGRAGCLRRQRTRSATWTVGYGPALYHRGETVQRIGRAFAPISEDALVDAYRSLDHTGLYPKGLWRREDREVESYLVENFLLLRSFLQHVKQHSLGVILRFT